MRALFLGVVLVGCGDPRADFVGHYSGSATQTVFFSDGTSKESSGPIDFSLTAPEKSDRLQFSGDCKFTAKVVDTNTLQVDAIACPPHQSTATSGATAVFQYSWSIGTASLSGKTLTIDQDGDEFGSDYSDGHPNAHFRVKMHSIASAP